MLWLPSSLSSEAPVYWEKLSFGDICGSFLEMAPLAQKIQKPVRSGCFSLQLAKPDRPLELIINSYAMTAKSPKNTLLN